MSASRRRQRKEHNRINLEYLSKKLDFVHDSVTDSLSQVRHSNEALVTKVRVIETICDEQEQHHREIETKLNQILALLKKPVTESASLRAAAPEFYPVPPPDEMPFASSVSEECVIEATLGIEQVDAVLHALGAFRDSSEQGGCVQPCDTGDLEQPASLHDMRESSQSASQLTNPFADSIGDFEAMLHHGSTTTSDEVSYPTPSLSVSMQPLVCEL